MNTNEQEHQKDLERIKLLRYIDDEFMTVCLKDNYEAVELILRIVLNKKGIKIKLLRTQEELKNLQGRSAILDVHAVGSDNKEFNVEIQRADKGADAKRARHNSSLLDAHILKAGDRTEDIPDSYVIFITENDIMKADEPVYWVERYITIKQNKVPFGDGSHILYVNGKYRGDDELGRLMHDFLCTDPDDMNYEALAKKARYFKQSDEGGAAMCQMLENMRNEAAERAAREATRVATLKATRRAELKAAKTARETAAKMIEDGEMSLEKIARYVPALSMDELKKIAAKIVQ